MLNCLPAGLRLNMITFPPYFAIFVIYFYTLIIAEKRGIEQLYFAFLPYF